MLGHILTLNHGGCFITIIDKVGEHLTFLTIFSYQLIEMAV